MEAAGARKSVDTGRLAQRLAVELGPALVFALTLQATGLVAATALFIIAVGAAVAYSWLETRHFPRIPAATLALAAILGGLTIAFDEATYIQIRATIINAAAAAAIVAGLATGRLLLKGALQEGFRMRDEGWRALSKRMAAYFVVLAVANEAVRLGLSTESWAWFKVAMPLLNAAFIAANWPLIRANLVTPASSSTGA